MSFRFRRATCSLGLVALIVLGLGASPSLAVNWVGFGEGKDGNAWYYDADSVRHDKHLMYIWVKEVHPSPQYVATARVYVSSKVSYWVVDCSSQTMAISKAYGHDDNDKIVAAETAPRLDFNPFPPGSVAESFLQKTCNLNADRQEAPGGEGRKSEAENTSTTGSGLVVSSGGLVLTNAHVVPRCDAIRVTTAGGEQQTASLVATDPQSDLALLRTKGSFSSIAGFRVGRPARLGEEVIALGYPLHGLLASGVNVSSGTVSALAGIANDSTKLQISAPVQPGNSGGPLLDVSGGVVGIVVAKLDAMKIAAAIGDIPQNVNFAIKADVARLFLEGQGVSPQLAAETAPRKKEDVAAIGRDFTVLVECLNGPDAR